MRFSSFVPAPSRVGSGTVQNPGAPGSTGSMREQHPARAVMVQYRAMARKHSFVLAPLLLPIVLGFLTQIYAQEKPPQEVLTNDAIVRMVQAHLGVDVIVEQIRNSP